MKLDFNNMFGNENVEIECPNCNKINKIKIQDAIDENEIKCKKCNIVFQVIQDKSFRDTMKSINKSLEDFNKTFKKFKKFQ